MNTNAILPVHTHVLLLVSAQLNSSFYRASHFTDLSEGYLHAYSSAKGTRNKPDTLNYIKPLHYIWYINFLDL